LPLLYSLTFIFVLFSFFWCALCCQFLCRLPLLYSLTFIHSCVVSN
jgi:hypothetical protein